MGNGSVCFRLPRALQAGNFAKGLRHGMASTDVAKGTEQRMGRLATKIAIVTGAANGIGRAIALRFAAEGAAVVIDDIDGAGLTRTAAAISSAGGTTAAVTGDLTEEGGAAALIDTAVDRHGRIDILVNNLGGSRNAKIWEMPVADFDFVLRLNLRSTFLCTRAAAAHMMKRRQGRIICMSSGAREGTPWTFLSGRRRLLGRQGRRSRVHSRRGSGARRVQHHGQCHRTGTD